MVHCNEPSTINNELARHLAIPPTPRRLEFRLVQGAECGFKQHYAEPAGVAGTLSQGTRCFDLRRCRFLYEVLKRTRYELMF